MTRVWEALMLRIEQWIKAKPSPEPLKPGPCECGHLRCLHTDASKDCNVSYPADNKWPKGACCACQVYIFDPDADDDDENDTPEAPTPSQLEDLFAK